MEINTLTTYRLIRSLLITNLRKKIIVLFMHEGDSECIH